MQHTIGNTVFASKSEITKRCRDIVSRTPDDHMVSLVDKDFLVALFRFHNGWERKSAGGVVGIKVRVALFGTRAFFLVRQDGSEEDISYLHAIRCIGHSSKDIANARSAATFKRAARQAIVDQTTQFKKEALSSGQTRCPITGDYLYDGEFHVDHAPPLTFDRLLFDFCKSRNINPDQVKIDCPDGMSRVIHDDAIRKDWQEFHRLHASLRLVSKTANLCMARTVVPWDDLGVAI